MGNNLQKLLEFGSDPLGAYLIDFPEDIAQQAGTLSAEFAGLCLQKNGFFAFESALHVFPVGNTLHTYNLQRWNSETLWRSEYSDMAEGFLFFAQDAFGEQFGLKDGYVWRFNPETGDSVQISSSLEEWAGLLLSDYEYETGYIFAHEWQNRKGRLLADHRILPLVPFVAGGKYELTNFYSENMVAGMKSRANLARQIRDLPNGSPIQIKFLEGN
ncbi:MAG: SMI1/KNR4 family protein [Chloroflexi bacterium]|uniref:SMI1/KNR4 family protein n=1 Tax=Candidatus Chlorohelix allophototropha TaxID=3003348 RepID=A0A8T7LYY9_9CHLR|nr:SMI1/KNR4 family protein [Chloroflexota bacterium]WJW66597.1 hypothetical protein OZ401_002401 [Chloroflexota bacterium L227-S17]